MKTITLTALTILTISAAAQSPAPRNNVVDLNYTAVYHDNLNLRWSSKLNEKDNWKLTSFAAGSSYNISRKNSQLAIVYDFARGPAVNAGISMRYGFEYKAQGPFTNLNLSFYQVEGTCNDGFTARLDLRTKF